MFRVLSLQSEQLNKGVAAYLVIFLILVVVVVLGGFIPGVRPINFSSTTTTANVIKNKTTTTTVIATASTTISSQNVCPSPNATQKISNGNFGTGTYYAWNVTANGFGEFPLNITYANNNGGYYGAPWSGYSGNFAASTTRGSSLSVQNGNLTSQPFLITEPFLNFKIVSPQNNFLYVEILQNNTPIIVTHYNTYLAPGNINPWTTFENASIPLGIHLCQNVSIRVVADVVGGSQQKLEYIAVTGFYLSSTSVATPGIVISQTLH